MGVGCSDCAWNMLAVNRQLHKWWSMGLWAVKCLGITSAGPQYIVRLQFHWMPKRSGLKRSREINLEKGEGQKLLDELTTWHGDPNTQPGDGGIVAASHVKSHQPLLSGHVFQIKFDGEDSKADAEKMKDMVDVQWALIVTASIAGAADPPELDDDDDDDSNYGAMEVDPDTVNDNARVQHWLEGAEAAAPPGEPSTPGKPPDLPPPQDPTTG